MKAVFFILLSLILFSSAFAQENDSIIVLQSHSGRLSGLINIQDLQRDNYRNDTFEGHWAGVEFGFNGFAGTDYEMYPESEKGFLDRFIGAKTIDEVKGVDVISRATYSSDGIKDAVETAVNVYIQNKEAIFSE